MDGDAGRVTDHAAAYVTVPWNERLAAFLAFKFGKRPSDALLDYCSLWAPTPAMRREAMRLLTKRNARRDADMLKIRQDHA